MKLTVESNMELLFEMANIRGKSVKIPHRLNFSFYFSPKDAVESKDICHGLRVKPLFDPEKMSIDKAGTLKLHGDWKYIPGSDDKNIGTKAIKEMKNFFWNTRLYLRQCGKKSYHLMHYTIILEE